MNKKMNNNFVRYFLAVAVGLTADEVAGSYKLNPATEGCTDQCLETQTCIDSVCIDNTRICGELICMENQQCTGFDGCVDKTKVC